MLKSLHSLGSCAENFLLIQISSILSVIFTRLWLKWQRMFWWASCTSARHAGSFDCLMTSLILITMDNGRGYCAYWQSCKVPNQTHRGMKKNRKMYAIKQIKICAEYRDMPRLDLSGTPGLRPIGLSPGSWQTSLGLGSMSRYSAQILICILYPKMLHSEQKCAHFCSEWSIVGYGTFAFWIWETRLLASIALLWLAGINLCWGITNHNEFWGHATRGNFNRFSQTTDSSLTHP